MDRHLISVCGPNGAGKSTFTKTVFSTLNWPVVDPDLYSSQGIGEIVAGKLSIRIINSYLVEGISFIKESTLTSNFDFVKFNHAKELGYENILIYLALPSVEESLQRVARRVAAGGHNIPVETILRRFEKSLKNLERAKKIVDHYFIIRSANAYHIQDEFQKMERLVKSFSP